MQPEHEMRESSSASVGATWGLALAFAVCGAAWLGSEGTYHGDERFYTDSVLRMLAGGDWLRPEYADGSARLNKPLLVYWLMGASMKLLGANLFAARLPFLLAGAALIPLTARLARALFPRTRGVALLAAALFASNSSILTLAVRCTPDILLVAAVAVAWIGLAELLVAQREPRACAWWLWGGIGLAAASKGSLAIVLALFAVAAVTLVARGAWRRLLHLPALALAVAVAGVSLAPLWLASDPRAGASFVEDQVASRLAASPLEALALAADYAGSTARHFAPWVLAPLLLWRRRRASSSENGASDPQERRALSLALYFAVTLWVVFSAANLHRGRYLAPCYPVLACALSAWVVRLGAHRAFGGLLRALTWLGGAVCALLAIALFRVDLAACASAALVAAVSIALARGRDPQRRPLEFALASFALLALAAPALRATFCSDYYRQAARLERLDATWGFDPSTPALVRVLSGGRLDPQPWPEAPDEQRRERDESVLVLAERAAELERDGWRLTRCGFRARRLKARDVLPLLRAEDPLEWFAAEGAAVFVAERER